MAWEAVMKTCRNNIVRTRNNTQRLTVRTDREITLEDFESTVMHQLLSNAHMRKLGASALPFKEIKR